MPIPTTSELVNSILSTIVAENESQTKELIYNVLGFKKTFGSKFEPTEDFKKELIKLEEFKKVKDLLIKRMVKECLENEEQLINTIFSDRIIESITNSAIYKIQNQIETEVIDTILKKRKDQIKKSVLEHPSIAALLLEKI